MWTCYLTTTLNNSEQLIHRGCTAPPLLLNEVGKFSIHQERNLSRESFEYCAQMRILHIFLIILFSSSNAYLFLGSDLCHLQRPSYDVTQEPLGSCFLLLGRCDVFTYVFVVLSSNATRQRRSIFPKRLTWGKMKFYVRLSRGPAVAVF